ncbi:MAG: taurine ABC transporter substrate-binding protein [Nocardioides sp.]
MSVSGCVSSGRTATTQTAAETDCPWEPDTSVKATANLAWQASPTGDLVVKDLGLLEACMPNATIKWSQFSSGGDVVQAFGAGSVDVGMLGSSPATIALSKPLEIPIKVVWIQEVIGEAEALVVHDKSITDLQGLAGKRIAVPFSSTSHFSLLQALDGAGLVPGKDVKLINLAPEAMSAAWDGNQIDAAWVWNPVLGELEKDGSQIYSSADTAEAGKPTYDLSAATADFAEANPDFMKQWAKAQDYAVQQIKDDPDKAAESIAIQMGISPKDVSDLFGGYIYLPASEQASSDWLDGKVAQDLITTAGFLLEQGSIKGVSSEQTYRDGVDPGPAQSVAE